MKVRPLHHALLLAMLFLVAACSGPAQLSADAGSSELDSGVSADLDAGADAGQSEDGGSSDDGGTGDSDAGMDAGSLDAGDEPDAGTTLPLPGFGTISGTCGVLDTELTSPDSFLFVNRIDFGTDPYDSGDFSRLTPGGQEIITDGNAGGSSLYSEVFSFELLARCEGASLLKTETEIQYTAQGSITDLLVEIDGLKVGVSVTRAVGFPKDDPYTVAQAKTILEKKLGDILVSSANVAPEDRWTKQILYVLAYAEGHATSIETALAQIDPAVLADTIVMVSISDGDDAFIY